MNEQLKSEIVLGLHDAPTNSYPVSLLSHWSTLPHKQEIPALATWDITTPAGKERLARALTAPSGTLWDMCETVEHEIMVDDITAHYGEYESEEHPGELVTGPIITMYGPSGAFHTGSEPAFRALQRISGILGSPPWHPSIIVKAYRRIGRNRRAYLHLEYIGRSVV